MKKLQGLIILLIEPIRSETLPVEDLREEQLSATNSAIQAHSSSWPAMQRRTARWAARFLAILGILFTEPSHAQALRPQQTLANASTARLPDGLGVWLTTVDSQVLYSSSEADQAIRFLHSNGFGRAAIPMFSGGHVYWPVRKENNRFGLSLDPKLERPDGVAPLIGALQRHGLRAVGWFEFGLMAPAESGWLQKAGDLLLQDSEGNTLWQESPGLNRVWLNPAIPAVQDYLMALVIDACTAYPLDAIQFDDHLGYPARFGYDPTTLGLWRRTPYGSLHPLPAAADPLWIEWRSGLITALLTRIRAAMATQCPAVSLSIAPNPQQFSYNSYLANWSDWVQQGLVDEVVVQIYRRDLASISAELADPSLAKAAEKVPVRIGVLAGLKGQLKDARLFREELNLLRSRGLNGIDLFFYETARQQFAPPP